MAAVFKAVLFYGSRVLFYGSRVLFYGSRVLFYGSHVFLWQLAQCTGQGAYRLCTISFGDLRDLKSRCFGHNRKMDSAAPCDHLCDSIQIFIYKVNYDANIKYKTSSK